METFVSMPFMAGMLMGTFLYIPFMAGMPNLSTQTAVQSTAVLHLLEYKADWLLEESSPLGAVCPWFV